MSKDPLSQAMQALSSYIVSDSSMGDTLQRVTDITMQALPGATVAGVAMLDSTGRPTTAVYTDETSPEVDTAQYESGNGPCLDAWRTSRVVRLDDMDDAMAQYPEFATACENHGLFSTLSLPLVGPDHAVGALNLYAPTRNAFHAEDEMLGMELATAAAIVVVNAGAYWDAYQRAASLRDAMSDIAVIEQAKGMLIARSGNLDAAGAFERLKEIAQSDNMSVREAAQRIVDRGPRS